MIYCGIDEAGRGPVIGPMVICGLCGDELKFSQIGVKDSKLLSKKKREYLYNIILDNSVSFEIIFLEPQEIDNMRKKLNLNEIEALYFAEIIKKIGKNLYVVDSADVDEDRFAEKIRKNLDINVEIISKHHADRDFPIVSAASIIAKVERDRRIEELKKIYGNFGSGYPSDPKTIEFLKNYFKENKEFPPIVRTSWLTLKKINTSFDLFYYGDKDGKIE
ncbi:MAG: ribonuclease HII [Thermoplasmata archaeon]